MMLTIHGLVGAALGRLTRHRPLAFLLGVVSHAIGDLLPHQECPIAVDGPLAAAALVVLARRFGIDSTEFIGALGAMAPDIEHLPTELYLRPDTAEVFPTHGPYPQPWPHSMARNPDDNAVQIGLAVAAILLLATD
jgi:hypothetical protein